MGLYFITSNINLKGGLLMKIGIDCGEGFTIEKVPDMPCLRKDIYIISMAEAEEFYFLLLKSKESNRWTFPGRRLPDDVDKIDFAKTVFKLQTGTYPKYIELLTEIRLPDLKRKIYFGMYSEFEDVNNIIIDKAEFSEYKWFSEESMFNFDIHERDVPIIISVLARINAIVRDMNDEEAETFKKAKRVFNIAIT
jgi:hypothetical protein